MTEPFQNDPYQRDPLHGDAMPRGARAAPNPLQRNRQLLIIAGLAVLALLLALAIWQSSGTRDAKNDFANANEKVLAKEREVLDARHALEQKIAELKVVRAEADVQAARLGNVVEEQVGGAVGDARLDVPAASISGAGNARTSNASAANAPVYYVRDQQGRFVPVTRP